MRKFMCILLVMVLAMTLFACGTKEPVVEESPAAEEETPAAEEETPAAEEPAAREDGLPAYTGEPCELRMTWWGDENRAERTQAVIDLFQAAYPEIKISGEPRPGDAYWDNLNTQLAGGNAPDIMQFGGNYPDFATKGQLEPLEGYLGKQLLIDTPETFDQAVFDPATLDGHLWCVCLGTNCLVLAYNKTMLEAAGAELPGNDMTWDEFIAYGESIKDKLPDGVFPFVDNSVNTANYLSYFMTQRDEPIWDGESTYVTLEGVKAWINMWEDMREAGLIPDIETTAGYAETGTDNSAFVAGKAAVNLIWSNLVSSYQGAMTDKIAICPLPQGENNALQIQVSQYLAINSQSEYKEAAALFINFFVTSPDAGNHLGTNRGIPSSPVVRTAIAGDATEIDAMLYEYLNIVADRTVPQGPNLPNDQEFVDTLKQIGQSVSFGELTREEGAQQIYDLIHRLMVK